VDKPEHALKKVWFLHPPYADDLDRESLVRALERNQEYLNRLDPEALFHYGPHPFTARQVKETQQAFLELIESDPDPDQLRRAIRRDFRVYYATGRRGNNRVLFTGYFEPVFDASLSRNHIFRYPIYRKPHDLIHIDLSLFHEKFEGERITARIDGNRVVPYYTRYHIEVEKALEGRGLELAWLKDPLDVTFLHIQGSGRLRLPDADTLAIGYEASNGRPYRSIGRYMLERGLMSREEMSMQGIRNYLSTHPEQMDEVLNHNPSYVFFARVEKGPLGNISVPLTPGRSLALDARLFPKGALAFIVCRKPLLDDEGKIKEWQKFFRFVLVQDTGGAIKGAGRADLFWGSGPYAEVAAGHMQHEGKLYILIKKPE
jgi:membrane-bound lytic murein transglycosylase A